MSSDIAIKVENLSKHYQIYAHPKDRLKQSIYPKLKRLISKNPTNYFHEFKALDNISFEVKKGETVGIIGKNGSGKSTLLQLICGTLNPTSGTIQTHGRIAALLELGSGFNPEFTGKENVYLNASILGLTHDEIDSAYSDIEAFADIGEFINQPIKTYSSGMVVRLAFAVIAHVNTDILVIDEALAVGDAFFTQKCMRFLRDFKKTGTVLFVSHDTQSIRSLCKSTIWLNKGEIKLIGDPKDVSERYLEAFFNNENENINANKTSPIKFKAVSEVNLDQRMKYINSSNLRNDLKVFQFNPETLSFGLGGANIQDVYLLDNNENQLSWVVGGELVTLRILIRSTSILSKPIVGFYLKDKFGQTLFGDNTYLTYLNNESLLNVGDMLLAEFEFFMPILPAGSYSVAVAVANGTQENHEQQHWIHDALIIESQSSSVSSGLVGIPMNKINLRVLINE